jgi:hypothetical protein
VTIAASDTRFRPDHAVAFAPFDLSQGHGSWLAL